MDDLTLAIAVFGAVTGAASLGWSVASHLLSGGRVRVELHGGWVLPSWSAPLRVVVEPFDVARRMTMSPRANNEPVLAVRVVNTGRLPISIDSWKIEFGDNALGPAQHPDNPPNPLLLGVGDFAVWVHNLEDVIAACTVLSERGQDVHPIRAVVVLGSGKRRTGKAIPLRWDALSAHFGIEPPEPGLMARV